MIKFECVDRNPVLSFFCALLVLYYIYGILWTIVIIFTLYLLDKTFKDTEGEKILGKPLLNVREKGQRGNSCATVNNRKIENSIRYKKMSSNNNSTEKRPTLQSLLYQKRNDCEVGRSPQRQPLAAVVKNNIQLNLSPNIDLEKRKPLYQSMHSPAGSSVKSKSSLIRCSGSPFSHNRSGGYTGFSKGSPLNRSDINTSFNVSHAAPLNESLEVHGSYFINKSVLHSPSVDKSVNRGYFSPSNVTFCNDTKSPVSNPMMKCSTESVVEALKQKSKRKRALPELSETCTKKARNDSCDIDTTLQDLLPTTERPSIEHISKRKIVDDKEVTSTGIQCYIDDDETIVRKKKKLQIDNASPKMKYGLTQGEINKLSDETSSINGTEIIVDDTNEIDKTVDIEKKESSDLSLKDTIRSIAYDCSFKSVSFSDTTPDKKRDDSINACTLKLSALKNIESPYKKLFNSGCTQNISPASIKKMRKHPIYFTAKINIDEVQQHREEFGESGVSLKAFRLDQEDAIKRVNNLFSGEDDVDFNAQPVSKIESATESTSAVSITSGISTNLFASSNLLASSSSIPSLTSPLVLSTAIPSIVVPSVSSLSFGNSTVSFPGVTSVVSTKGDAVVTTSILSSSQLNIGLSVPDGQTQPASTVISTYSAGTLSGTSSSLIPASTSLGAGIGLSVIPTLPNPVSHTASTSSNLNFSFGAIPASAASQQLTSQFTLLQKPVVSSTSALDGSIKVLSSLDSQVNNINQPASASVVTTVSNSVPLNFAFQAQPTASVSFLASNQNTIASVNPASFQETFPASSSLVSSTAPLQAANVGATHSTVLPGISFSITISSSSVSTVTSVTSSTLSLPSIFGQPAGNVFATSLPTATTQQSVFGIASSANTISVPQPSIFGVASSAPVTLPSIVFDNSQKAVITSQSSIFGSAASVPSFIQGTTKSIATSTVTGNVFAPPSNTSGFSFASTVPSTGFNFGTGLSQGNVSSANNFNVSSSTAAQNNMFGQTIAPTTNMQPSQNIFGAPVANTTSQPIFGAPTVSMAPTQNIFGTVTSTTPSTQSIFGSSAQGTFGSAAQNTFGSSSNQNVFGATQQPSIFGDQSKISTGFNFGTTAATTAPSGGFSFGTSTSTSSVFGQSNNIFGGGNATSNTGIFGGTKPAENVFGQQQKPATGFDFSSSLSQGPAINFGNTAAPTVNGFATQQPQSEIPKPSFNFGSKPATPTFGSTPASPAFGGGQQPIFGNAQAFGTPNVGAGGGFTIGSGTSNPPPTRQTQRARRRLRR